MRQPSFFDGERMNMRESIELSLASLREYIPRHRHIVLMFSGGKDSAAAMTFTLWAIATGRVPLPASITVVLADTRLELPPLMRTALLLLDEAKEAGASCGYATASLPSHVDRTTGRRPRASTTTSWPSTPSTTVRPDRSPSQSDDAVTAT